MHYDLEHSAFVLEDGQTAAASVDMGGGVLLTLPLSDAIRAAPPSPTAEKDYAETPYPSAELRILAAYKLWGAMHYFFAYRDLMDADWDDEFPKFLDQFAKAKDAREYHWPSLRPLRNWMTRTRKSPARCSANTSD